MKNRLPDILCLLFVSLCIVVFLFRFSAAAVPIDGNVEDMMEYMGFGGCFLSRLAPYKNVPYAKLSVSVTDETVDAYIQNDLSQYDQQIMIDDRSFVREGDIVVLDYTMSYNGEVIKSEENRIVNIGKGWFDKDIEKQLEGQEKCTGFSFSWLVPDDERVYGTRTELAGKYIQIDAYIHYAYYIEEAVLTDDFVKTEKGLSGVEEYRSHVRDLLHSDAQKAAVSSEKAAIIKAIIDGSRFTLDEQTVLDNAVSILYEYRSGATAYGMTYDEYLQNVLQLTESELYERCYRESEDQIKTYLAIGCIAYAENITVTDAEIDEFLRSNGQAVSQQSAESLCYVEYRLLEEKVLNFIYENAAKG